MLQYVHWSLDHWRIIVKNPSLLQRKTQEVILTFHSLNSVLTAAWSTIKLWTLWMDIGIWPTPSHQHIQEEDFGWPLKVCLGYSSTPTIFTTYCQTIWKSVHWDKFSRFQKLRCTFEAACIIFTVHDEMSGLILKCKNSDLFPPLSLPVTGRPLPTLVFTFVSHFKLRFKKNIYRHLFIL